MDGCTFEDYEDKTRKHCIKLNLPDTSEENEATKYFVLISTQSEKELEKWKIGIKAKTQKKEAKN